MFSGKNIVVTGGNFTVQEAQEAYDSEKKEAIDRLRKIIAPGAFHNAAERYDPPRCHEGTREAITKEVMDWIQSLDKKELFLWIYGPAGAGKSAIGQTIAEICFKLGLLAASFFFSRSTPGRNNDKLLIPTIAYQLTISIPEIRDHIAAAIVKDPLIFGRTLKDQFDTLIAETLKELPPRDIVEGLKPRPRLIIIDGLDECSEPNTQSYILSTLSSFSLRDNPNRLSFLVASRPEFDIRNAFNEDRMNSLTRRLVLDDKYLPNADIRHFLSSKFDEIRARHPLKSLIPPSWPSPSDLNYLVEKSSGQFIYASTVAKFVESPRHRPTDRLDIIFGLKIPGKNTPFAQLDALYAYIFESIDDIEPVIKVLSLFVTGSKYPRRDPGFIEEFLLYQPGDLQIILADLHSIIHIPPFGASEGLYVFHASLGDFLLDKSRSGTFFIDISKAHATMAQHAVTYLPQYPKNYEPFLEHLLNAYPTDELLMFLSHCRLEECFNLINHDLHVQRPASKNLPTKLSIFFRLLQNEFTADIDGHLHRTFQSRFDGYLLANLSCYTSDPDFYHIVTAFTLNCTSVSKWDVCDILPERHGGNLYNSLRFSSIDHDTLRFYDGIAEYRSAMVAFFADSTRSGSYYVGRTRYIDLAIKCVEYFDRLDWLKSQSHYQPRLESYALSVISEILSRFPGERQLADILRDKPLRNMVEDKEIVVQIEAYLKGCNTHELDSTHSGIAEHNSSVEPERSKKRRRRI